MKTLKTRRLTALGIASSIFLTLLPNENQGSTGSRTPCQLEDNCSGRTCYIGGKEVPCSSLLRRQTRSAPTVAPPSLTCGETALCGTLNGVFNWVYGQVGIYYFNADLNRNVFVPLYVEEAAISASGDYRIPKWDGKALWMNVNPLQGPLWLQPFYVDADTTSCAGCMKFVSRAMLYRQQGKDYSAYPYNAALMYMYITLDADFRVKDYVMDVYDQDDNVAQTGVKLNPGDTVQALYVEDDHDDASPEWDLVTLEEPVTVMQPPIFEYAGYIPGRDYSCTYCKKIDLPASDLFFRIVGYTHDATTNTDKPAYSERVALGKLRDHAAKNDACFTTSDALDMQVACAHYQGVQYGFTMNYETGADGGHYWRMNPATLSSPLKALCMPVGDDLIMKVCADYRGVQYDCTLNYSPAPGALRWKADFGTLKVRQ